MSGETDSVGEGKERDGLEADGFNYIRLGTLLRTARSPRKRSSVERVLASNASLLDKIHEIERIDGLPEEGERHGEAGRRAQERRHGSEAEGPAGPSGPAGPAGPAGDAAAFPSDDRARADADGAGRDAPGRARLVFDRSARVKHGVVEASRARQALRREPARIGFLDFAMSWRARMRAFAGLNPLVRMGFLGLFPRIDGDAVAAAGRALARQAERSREAAELVIATGWRRLDRREYNLVALGKRLLDEIARAPFPRFAGKRRDAADVACLFAMETAWLSVRAIEGGASDLLNAVDTVLQDAWAGEDERRAKALEALGTLVRRPAGSGSPGDIALALASARARRPIAPEELMAPERGPLLCVDEWDCPPPVQAEIDALVDETVASLPPLVARARALAGEFGFSSEGGLPDFGACRERLGLPPLSDPASADAAELARKLAASFLSRFAHFLSGEMPTADFRKVRPLPKGAFDYELERLEMARDRLSRRKDPLKYARFRAIVSGATPTGFEAEAVEEIAYAAEWLRKIGEKAVAARRAGLARSEALACLDEEAAGTPLSGRSGPEWLKAAASTALLASGYLLDTTCLGAAREFRRLRDSVERALATVRRLASRDEWLAVEARYSRWDRERP